MRLRVPTRDWIVVLLRIAVTSTKGRHDGLGISDGEGPRSHQGKPQLVHPLTLSTSVPVPKNRFLAFGSLGQLYPPVRTLDQMRAVAHRRQSGHSVRRRQPRTDLAPWRPQPADSAVKLRCELLYEVVAAGQFSVLTPECGWAVSSADLIRFYRTVR